MATVVLFLRILTVKDRKGENKLKKVKEIKDGFSICDRNGERKRR